MSSPSSRKWEPISQSPRQNGAKSKWGRRRKKKKEKIRVTQRREFQQNEEKGKRKVVIEGDDDDTHKPDYPITGVWPLLTTISLLTEFLLSQSRD